MIVLQKAANTKLLRDMVAMRTENRALEAASLDLPPRIPTSPPRRPFNRNDGPPFQRRRTNPQHPPPNLPPPNSPSDVDPLNDFVRTMARERPGVGDPSGAPPIVPQPSQNLLTGRQDNNPSGEQGGPSDHAERT